VYELFISEMCIRVAKAKAPNSWKHALGGEGASLLAHNLFADRRVSHLVNLLKTHLSVDSLKNNSPTSHRVYPGGSDTISRPTGINPVAREDDNSQPSSWFPKGWRAEMEDALGSVVRKLRSEHGPSPEWWQWGGLRTLHLTHHLFGKHWMLGKIFNIEPVACGGDSNTISQAGAVPLNPLKPTHNMANLRCAFDTANWSNSRIVLAGGQSGNPLSPHFRDLFGLWQNGEAVKLPFTREEVLKAAVSTLRLLPG
jgi:penicillin amidase